MWFLSLAVLALVLELVVLELVVLALVLDLVVVLERVVLALVVLVLGQKFSKNLSMYLLAKKKAGIVKPKFEVYACTYLQIK